MDEESKDSLIISVERYHTVQSKWQQKAAGEGEKGSEGTGESGGEGSEGGGNA